LLNHRRFYSRVVRALARRWWAPVLVIGLGAAPLATRPAALPWGATIPVPRALLHADGDGNRIYDDLETRLERADPSTPVPAVVLFDGPLERVSLAELTAQVGPFPVTARFPREAALAARLTPAQVRGLAALPGVTHVEGDDWLSVTRELSEPAFGVTQAREDFQLTGDGDGAPDSYNPRDHTIAVIDTGIDGNHQDFAGGKIIGWVDFVNGKSQPYDDMGHGTHVASIAAGRMRDGVGGVAPDAALVGVKVITKEGNARTIDVVKGLEWCINNRDDYGIRVINLSLSGSGSADGTDIMARAIRECIAAGIVVCVAVGNSGPAAYTTPAPGATAEAITVGNMRDPARGGFALWTSSGRGPTADGRIKPDVIAPGYQIWAAKAGTTSETTFLTGSSMATPFVSGVCALMLEANPELTPAEVKQILRETAIDFGPQGEDIDYGAGRLDAYAAIQAALPPAQREAGAAPPVPAHYCFSGSLQTGGTQEWAIDVSGRHNPIAAVLIVPGWTATTAPRFELALVGPDGAVLSTAAQERREQILSFRPLTTGTYRIRINALAGQGAYFVDVSGDLATPGGQAQGARLP
jgi:serine protease AprX